MTVDLTNTCIVVWEKTPGLGIDRYVIWKDDGQGVFSRLASVDYAEYSEYRDLKSTPDKGPVSYKLSYIDSLGNESAQSAVHSTMHLSLSIGTSNQMQCMWMPYVGFNFEFFRLWEGSTLNPMAVSKDSIDSKDRMIEDWTLDMNSTILYYMVEVDHPVGCTIEKGKTKNYNNSRSNKSGIATPPDPPQGIYEWEVNQPRLFPNPITGTTINLQVSDVTYAPETVRIFDLEGKTLAVFRPAAGTLTQTFELPEQLPAGTYFIIMETPAGAFTEKVAVSSF